MDLKFKTGWTASSSLTSIFRLAGNEYGDYNHIALVDMTGKTPNDSTKEWILNNIEEVAVGTNTTMVYDYKTCGRNGAAVGDVQCAYDFTSLPKSDERWHWSPTDVLILKADMCRCSSSIGKLEKADVNVFLKIHARFSGYDYLKASDINGTCCNLP